MILRTVIGLIALLVCSPAQADFFTYQTWSAMPETARAAYIAGAFDSFVTVTNSQYYNKCINTARMTIGQLSANVLNFAKDKPELHTGPVQSALLGYLAAACGKPPTIH